MSDRIIVRCIVYDAERVVELIEQPVPRDQLRVAFLRQHFNSRLIHGMDKGYRVVFESRPAKVIVEKGKKK